MRYHATAGLVKERTLVAPVANQVSLAEIPTPLRFSRVVSSSALAELKVAARIRVVTHGVEVVGEPAVVASRALSVVLKVEAHVRRTRVTRVARF